MELNLEGGSLKYYERICSASYTCEDTSELIVPDAQPDAEEILSADGQSYLRGKEARKNALVISGVSEVTVLYRTENGDLRHLRLEVPFEGENPCPGLAETDTLTACVHLVSAEARMLNSRKLVVRVIVCIFACAWSPRELNWAKEASADGAELEQRHETLRLFPVTRVTEKTFSASELLPLPAGKPAVGEILYHRVSLQKEEANPVGGRLILRGTAFLSVVYLSQNGDPAEAELRAPWSAILEVPETDGERSETVTLAMTGSSAELADGGISFELGGVVQASVRGRTEVRYLSDAYAVGQELSVRTEQREMTASASPFEQTDVLTLTLEGRRQPRSLTAIFADCGKPRRERDEVRVPVTAKALCTDENGMPVLLTGQGEAVCRNPEVSGLRIGEIYAAVSSAGSEVRVPVLFSGEQTETAALSLVTGGELAESKADENRPSAILLRAAPGDTVWSLGKRKRLPCASIRSVNGLPEGAEPAPGTLLLLAK